ncbi:MAG: serine hydrolase domain-containing protein, partial [Pseudomonadota bacterium]
IRGFMLAMIWLSLSVHSAASDDDLRDAIDDLITEDRYAEVALWIDGELYTGTNVPARDERVFVLASVSKAVLSVALMQMHGRGVLNIDDRLDMWLPEDILALVDGLHKVTIAQLLTMRSGLPEYLNRRFYDAWFAGDQRTRTPIGALSFAKSLPVVFQPDEAFEYTNTNYLLAQLVLEVASGQTMSAYFESEIFAPAGMFNTDLLGFQSDENDLLPGYEDVTDRGQQERVDHLYDGQGFGDGGLTTRAEDVVKFYKALLVDRTLLGRSALRRLLKPGPDENYAMGLVVEGRPGDRVISHGGAFIGYVSNAIYVEGENVIGASLIADARGDAALLIDETLRTILE